MTDRSSHADPAAEPGAGGGASEARRHLSVGLARALGGALIFALPMLMTMEMWQLGFYMDRARLALLLLVNIPLLTALSYHVGFEETFRWWEDVRDALIAFGIGIVVSAVILILFGVVAQATPMDVMAQATPKDELIGKIALQAVPASIGAMLGRSQLGARRPDESPDPGGTAYASELFLMAIGALFLSLNVAPTEEMVLISFKMTEWHALAVVGLSLMLMHGFVYAVEFAGQASLAPGMPGWVGFLRFTVVGYALVLLISLYALWTFGRTDGTSLTQIAMATAVLSFPGAIGAAAARLIL